MRRLLIALALAFAPLAAAAQLLTLGVGPGGFGVAVFLSSINGPANPAGRSAFDDASAGNGVVGDGDGFTGIYIGTPPAIAPYSSPLTFTVTRHGWYWNGSAFAQRTFTDTRTVTALARQPVNTSSYPLGEVFTTGTMVFDDEILADDSVAGVTNHSDLVAPLPVCQWRMVDREVKSTTLWMQAECTSKYARASVNVGDSGAGQEIAGITFTATDNLGATASCNAHTETLSADANTGWTNPNAAVPMKAVVYGCQIDISGLANPSYLTADAAVYSWVGLIAYNSKDQIAVQSPGGSIRRQFSSRYFSRRTTNVLAAYVCNGANAAACGSSSNPSDSTCVFSTTDATALASPCITIKGAFGRLIASAGRSDDVTIYVMNNTGSADVWNSTTVAVGTAQTIGSITITGCNALHGSVCAAAPTVSLNASVSPKLPLPTVNAGPWPIPVITESQIIFDHVAFDRGGNFQFSNTVSSPVLVVFKSFPSFNLQTQTTNLLSVTGPGNAAFYGGTFTNYATTGTDSTFAATTGEKRAFVDIDATASYTKTAYEGWYFSGVRLTHFNGLTNSSARADSGTVLNFNQFRQADPLALALSYGGTTNPVNGFSFVQNVFEVVNGNNHVANFFLSGDLSSKGVTGAVVHYNSFIGGGQAVDRMNWCMENAAGAVGSVGFTCNLNSFKGNIFAIAPTKSDLFCTTGTAGACTALQAPFRTGVWSAYYGVGWRDNMVQYSAVPDGGGFPNGDNVMHFAGLNSNNLANYGTNWVTAGWAGQGQLDPKYVTDAGTYFDGGCSFTATTSNAGNTLVLAGAPTCATGSGTTAALRVGSHIEGGVIPNNTYIISGAGLSWVLSQAPGANTSIAMTSGNTNGAGSSDGHLNSNSPAKGLVCRPGITFDIEGTTRRTNCDDAGAYVAN